MLALIRTTSPSIVNLHGDVYWLLLAGAGLLAIPAFIIYTRIAAGFTIYGVGLAHIDLSCVACSGGRQWLEPGSEGGWGAIPEAFHLEKGKRDDGTFFFRPPQANTRTCRCCQGIGHRYYYKAGEQNPYNFKTPCGSRLEADNDNRED